MKKLMVLVFLLVLIPLALNGYCKQEYNAMENRWETVPENSSWNMKYNAMNNDWSYQPDNSKQEYNAMENKWDWDSGHNPGNGSDKNDE
ncbi:MAG: hypothetical protein P9M13_01255 [Candidatus Ancaeobacter aquaticus]|nr:hypothetical protein [Candidatus Ancaeobacter aquaticus]